MDAHSIPAASGIYRIVNTINGKFYLGSTNNLFRRWQDHRKELRRKAHHSITLQRAWDKYGESTFVFEVIELVLPPFLLEREQYWLDKLHPYGKKGYNISQSAQSPTLGRKYSPESCERLRISHLGNTSHLGFKHSPEALVKIGAANKGRIRTPETIEKIRVGLIGRECAPETREKIGNAKRGQKHSPETIAKMMGRYVKTIIATSPDGTEYTVVGIRQFCKEHNLDATNLCRVARGQQKHHKGWTARYPETDVG